MKPINQYTNVRDYARKVKQETGQAQYLWFFNGKNERQWCFHREPPLVNGRTIFKYQVI
jgi:hypothetical protein